MSEVISTTCPYCGVGCGVQARVADERLIAVAGSATHPANAGRLCIKGSNLPGIMTPQGRLLKPVVDGRETGWEDATAAVARRFNAVIDNHGPDAVAFYLSGQLLTEDYYVANKLIKGFIGTANVDTNSRLCMASAVAAHKRAFGEDVVPCNYTDLERSDLIVLCGSNAAWAHPIVYQRISAAKQARGTRVVVIDPRRTATCDLADQHLALRAGSDTALFNGLFTYLHDHAAIDREYMQRATDGYSEALNANRLSVATAAELTGLSVQELVGFYRCFANTEATVTVFSQGVNQAVNGTDKANAIINCHLATGRIGRPGMGPFSITGQPNAMGGREVGGLANQLAAHMDFDPAALCAVEGFWKAPNMARAPGLKAVEMFDAIYDGRVKAVWIMGTNPAVSLPDSTRVRRALARCETVVVSDCMAETDTTVYADVLLPALGWGEKDGTVTNSERCISRQRRLVPAPGEARPDWQIVSGVAQKMGYASAFDYTCAFEIFAEHVALSTMGNVKQRVFDLGFLSALTAQGYDDLAPVAWPKNDRPFARGTFSTSNHRARFIPTAHREPMQTPSCAYPLTLNTGRYRDQWHTMTRTGWVPKLFSHNAEPRISLHPADAASRGISTHDLVTVSSATGSLRLIADVTSALPPGMAFAPIHWSDRFTQRAVVSGLFDRTVDPVSGQPESKHAAVQCRRVDVDLSWVRLYLPSSLSATALEDSQGVAYWCVNPSEQGFCYEMAVDDLKAILAQLGLEPRVTYVDHDGQCRYLGHTPAGGWLLYADCRRQRLPEFTHIQQQITASVPDWQKLSIQGLGAVDTSALICTCFEVRRERIEEAICSGCDSLETLGEALGCGTNCGSCIPELNQLLRSVDHPSQVASR